MRFGLSVAVVALMLASGLPAHAQQNQQQTSYVYGGTANTAPVYNSNVGSVSSGTGTTSIYNSGSALQMLPMQRMIAGQNAPSYTYGNQRQGTQPYTNYSMGTLDPNAIGSLTADQARMIREQRNAQANAYQQQYMEQLRQRDLNNPYLNPTSPELQQMQQQLAGASQYQGGQFAPLYANSGQQKPTVKRKVIYNELNNPLVDPPRLFNIQ